MFTVRTSILGKQGCHPLSHSPEWFVHPMKFSLTEFHAPGENDSDTEQVFP